jgi:hypothetical protein
MGGDWTIILCNPSYCGSDVVACGVSTFICDGVAIFPQQRTPEDPDYQVPTSHGRRHGIEGRDSLLPSIHVFFGKGRASVFDRKVVITRLGTLLESALHDFGREILA